MLHLASFATQPIETLTVSKKLVKSQRCIVKNVLLYLGHILTSPIAGALPTLPFHVLKTLFDVTPLTTDDGVLLRRMTLDIGAVHLVLACLSVLSHHAPRVPIPGFHQEVGKTLKVTIY